MNNKKLVPVAIAAIVVAIAFLAWRLMNMDGGGGSTNYSDLSKDEPKPRPGVGDSAGVPKENTIEYTMGQGGARPVPKGGG